MNCVGLSMPKKAWPMLHAQSSCIMVHTANSTLLSEHAEYTGKGEKFSRIPVAQASELFRVSKGSTPTGQNVFT